MHRISPMQPNVSHKIDPGEKNSFRRIRINSFWCVHKKIQFFSLQNRVLTLFTSFIPFDNLIAYVYKLNVFDYVLPRLRPGGQENGRLQSRSSGFLKDWNFFQRGNKE